ncbi:MULTISPECIES: nitroreductase family protein [Acinetobacter]|uniref:NAD(P)H-dependent oxidoreductase n=1 Tax=Acinetobacter chengduensis TaxID=2420890 RepID=A0ABX9TXW8_9GAMM|nr:MULTISPECIES: nitroreductase family protein [Acinetobacter]MBI1452302.1 nitroreductase family protein [Acinetobacter sp. FL51]RKG43250.1 NAD(P)H-dependent oxidoreductase [Acinetobacter sp. WCHAc060007]RLL23091.1 NAD(P)H-dependent oxidoreductase [Acinetobacter chengduensis]
MKLLEALNWRYATKQMTGEKLDQSDVDLILEAARLAPTSAGLQPFHIISISNQELKEKISPVALNQPQIIQSSHLLVFTAWDSISDVQIDQRYDAMNALRNLSSEKTAKTVAGLKQLFASMTQEQQYHHAAKQAHIGFGMAIAAAAELGIDATPMEGFDKDGLDKVLNLKEKGLKSVVLLALGRRNSENDWLLNLKKFRITREEFVTDIQ